MNTTVINIHTKKHYDIFMGRPGTFGNPFIIGRDGDRAEVIRKYRAYFCKRLATDSEFADRVQRLDGQTLGCYCKPQPCHCDVVVEYLASVGSNGGLHCGPCGSAMSLSGIDVYKCNWCGHEIDAGEGG